MKKFLLGSIAIVALAAGSPAIAADMVFKAPVPAVVYDWTGFYAGGGVSYSWGRIRDTGTYLPGFYFQQTQAPTVVGAATTTRPINHTIRGLDGEIQGGYRRQFGTWVAGVEAIARLTNQRGTGTCLETYPNGYPSTLGTPIASTAGGTFSCYKSTRLNSTEALLLQGGVLPTPNLLVQLSVGPALGQIHATDAFVFSYSNGAVTAGSSSQTKSKGGYSVGGGAEYAIPNTRVHIKLEYAHMDFGTVNTTTMWTDTTIFCTATISPTGCVHTFRNGRRVTDDSILIGLNYAFGAPVVAPAPIYTKY